MAEKLRATGLGGWSPNSLTCSSQKIVCSNKTCSILIKATILLQVKIWFQNRRMKWRNSKERELLASGGSREQTLPNKNNPHPDLSDAEADKQKLSPLSPINDEQNEEKSKVYPTTSEFQGYEAKMSAGALFAREFPNIEDAEEFDSDASASDEEINVT